MLTIDSLLLTLCNLKHFKHHSERLKMLAHRRIIFLQGPYDHILRVIIADHPHY